MISHALMLFHVLGVQKNKVDCDFVSINWRLMYLILKYFLLNDKYTSGLCYIMCKEHIPNIKVVYYFVCALAHFITCTCPVDCKAKFELHVLLSS